METDEKGYEFSIVSVAPTKLNHIDPRAVASIRSVSAMVKQEFTGINVNEAGRPGRSLKNTGDPVPSQYESHCESLLESLKAETEQSRPVPLSFSLSKASLLYNTPGEKLSFRFYKSGNKLIKNILENRGLRYTEKYDWNLLWAGTIPPSFLYSCLHPYQKVSHFPSSFEMTRKDRLTSAIKTMQDKHPCEYDFFPDTFILPEEFSEFSSAFSRDKKGLWIIKPIGSSQGKGIHLIDSMAEVPIEEVCVISKYLHNPLLINGLKFDLRIYVLITSYEPLLIYFYEEGLVRFASEPYKTNCKHNRFIHLTNYSLNKKNNSFLHNQDFRVDDSGHKWSLSALSRLLKSSGIDTGVMWGRIYDLVIKTVISHEAAAVATCVQLGLDRGNCFDLLGFDVLLDDTLKPWLLEVNLSPSLATESPLDSYIKSGLVVDLLNLIGLRHIEVKVHYRPRYRSHNSTVKRSSVQQMARKQSPGFDVTKRRRFADIRKHKECLRDLLEEQQRRGRFLRIYPALGSINYDRFFETIRPVNSYIYNALYMKNPLNADIVKLIPIQKDNEERKEETAQTSRTMKTHQTVPLRCNRTMLPDVPSHSESVTTDRKSKCRSCMTTKRDNGSTLCISCKIDRKSGKEAKIVVTVDDLLEEYVVRLINCLKQVQEGDLEFSWKQALSRFLDHYAWKTPIHPRFSFIEKFTIRLSEIQQRKRKSLLALRKTPQSKVNFLIEQERERQKKPVISKISPDQLGKMLKMATHSVVHDLILYLTTEGGTGVLTILSQMINDKEKTLNKALLYPTVADLAGYEGEDDPESA